MTPSQALPAVLENIDADLDQSLERLFEFLRIQSISTDPAYNKQCQAAADLWPRICAGIGFETSVRPTDGHPVVVGKGGGAGNGKARASCSTATTTCSRSIRSISGRRRRSRRASRRCPTAARSSSRAAPATTKAR